jgi:hypothetical protein
VWNLYVLVTIDPANRSDTLWNLAAASPPVRGLRLHYPLHAINNIYRELNTRTTSEILVNDRET